MLTEACEDGVLDAVYAGTRDFGFGDAVISALEQDQPAARAGGDSPVAETGSADGSQAEVEDWLWLLHDDAAPAPDALAQLLAHLAVDPAIDITGPKLLLPQRRRRPQQLSEVGLSIAGSGRRELGLESGEIDQGQRDEPAPKLAVSSCGMLVRTRIWDELQGFDPAIPGLRDGLEFGWRAQLAGYRVVTTPAAEMVHRHVGRAGLRPSGFARSRPDKADRELGLVLVAAHARAATYPLFWLRLVLAQPGCAFSAICSGRRRVGPGTISGRWPGSCSTRAGCCGSGPGCVGSARPRRAETGSPRCGRPGGRGSERRSSRSAARSETAMRPSRAKPRPPLWTS